MKYLATPILLALLTTLALSVFFAGCSRSHVPVPEKNTAYTQKRVQATEHWRDIAVDVAEKIRNALVERNDLVTKPIYVALPNSRPFMLAFHQMVKTELVSRAIQVSEQREPDTVLLEYDVLTTVYDSSRFNNGVYSHLADLGIGVGRLFSGTSASDHEIMVNVRMAYHNRYVAHLSYIRYINDADWPMYLGPESLNPSGGGSRLIRVTSR